LIELDGTFIDTNDSP